ncbi:MAG: group II intron maturase-specific domain-containing protein [Limisphaerales bacterium]
MLETLARGIKGGIWFSLIDKAWKKENLQNALKTVVQNKGAAGVDGQKAEQYLRESPYRLEQVQHRLRKGQYSMENIIGEVNRTRRGRFEYFQHSVSNVFAKEDQWVRGRLRAILRKRHQGQGRARGLDHQRWPNAYFAELGLFSLALARAQAIQSRKRTTDWKPDAKWACPVWRGRGEVQTLIPTPTLSRGGVTNELRIEPFPPD